MKRFTDRQLRALKPATNGRYELFDPSIPRFGIRVNDKGLKTFFLSARVGGSKAATRLTLGHFDRNGTCEMTLAEARDKATEWRKLIAKGIDPRAEEERQRRAEERRQGHTFEAVATDFYDYLERSGLRRWRETRATINRELMPLWKKRAITDIEARDLIEILDQKRKTPYAAHHVFNAVRDLFSWAINRHAYGLTASPCDRMKPSKIIGSKQARKRTLNDHELKAVWFAAKRMGYPFGRIVQMLILTGQRRSEVSEAQRDEIDDGLWTIPAARMKNKSTHVLPLTDDMAALIESLPAFEPFPFSTTFGRRPFSGFSKAKKELDALALRYLRVFARIRGEDWRKVTMRPWVLHDIRRTVRTHLSALPIDDMVRELVISHSKPGLHKVYDQHQYTDEKREALRLWNARLLDIIRPVPDNVIRLQRRA